MQKKKSLQKHCMSIFWNFGKVENHLGSKYYQNLFFKMGNSAVFRFYWSIDIAFGP